MKNRALYFLIFVVCLGLSCRQQSESTEKANAIDSLVNNFNWTENKPRDSVNKFLNSLLANPKISTIGRFKVYGHFCAYYYFGQRDLTKALAYADSMILTIEKSSPSSYPSELAKGYFSKGDLLFALGKYDESFANYHYAKKLISFNKDKCTSSDYSYRIGMVLYKQAKYENAAYFFSQGFSESVDCKQDFAIVFRRQELLNNQALCYTRLEKLDSALIIYRKALAYINQNDTISERKVLFDVARGVVLGNIGGVYAKMKSYRAAEEYLKKSIRINIRPSYENNDAALTQVKLARLYLDLNSLKKAEVILQDLRTSVGKLNLPEASRSYHYLYAQYLKKIGDHSGAYHHLWRYTKMADSAQKVLAATNSPDINERFQNLDSRTEINFLKKEQELQQIYLVITILLALMAIVIILLIYFYWRKSRKTVDMLTQLNNTVQEQKLQLEDTLLNLENSDKEKDSLLRAVAHDLRNPIGGISSLVELMIAEDTDKEVKQQHQLIKDTCLNTLELINELIEASENQNPVNVVDKLSSIDIVGLVANAVELLKFKAREKHQQIKFDTIQSPIVVNVNPEKILRVINNLISNAIKFSHENSTIEVSIAITNQHVKITVSDYGIGIPLAMQENVFQMFTPAKRFGTKGEKSYGLGLSISKQIINAHKGEIWFEPNDNGGTRFCFSLPI